MSFHDTSASQAIHNQRFMRAGLAIKPRQSAEQEKNHHHSQPTKIPISTMWDFLHNALLTNQIRKVSSLFHPSLGHCEFAGADVLANRLNQ